MANTIVDYLTSQGGAGTWVAQTPGSDAAIDASPGLAVAEVVEGSLLASMPNWEVLPLVAFGAGTGNNDKGQLRCENDGSGNFTVKLEVPGDGQTGGSIAKSGINVAETYIAYGHIVPTGVDPRHYIALYAWNSGSPTLVVGSDASQNYGASWSTAVGGFIALGLKPVASSVSLIGWLGEFKVHSQLLSTITARTKAPESGDADLLNGYLAEEGSGSALTEVLGGTQVDLVGTEGVDYNWVSGGVWAASGPPVVDVSLPATGSTLSTLASGLVAFTIAASPVGPTGSTLLTLASDVPAITVEANVGVPATGSTLLTLASGVPVIDVLSDLSVSPTGDTLGTLDDNSAVELQTWLEMVFLSEGSALQTLAAGVPSITGQAADVFLSPDSFDGLSAVESGSPQISTPSVGNIDLIATGTSLQTLQSGDVTDIIDTDNIVVIASGSPLGTVSGTGVPTINVAATGITVLATSSTLLLVVSGSSRITSSHPTAPPGTAGGRLIIRSITRNVTRPVTHTPTVAVQAFNA